MKTIAFANMKGGVGKSSLAGAVAVELARGGDTLLIDSDSQASLSGWLAPAAIRAELADVLLEKTAAADAITRTAWTGLFMLPSFGLGGELNVFAETQAGRKRDCIRKVARTAAALGYRYCVLDMRPDFGPLERAALLAADEVIVPLTPEAFAASGLEIFSERLKSLRADAETDKPYFSRIVVNGIDGRVKLHAVNVAKMKAAAGEAFVFYEIPVDPCFRTAQTAGLAIQDLANTKKKTLNEIRRLARAIQED
jgi:chromosome partitioning protein